MKKQSLHSPSPTSNKPVQGYQQNYDRLASLHHLWPELEHPKPPILLQNPMAPNTIARNGFLLLLLFMWGTLQAQAMKPKETHVSFYMHDLVGGKVTTGLAVAGPNGSNSNVLSFGTVTVLDHRLTERFHPRSSQVGRAQGIYVGSALNGQSLHFVFSIIFTNRRYNGSTLEIQGADRLELSKREVSVVSGTGQFRFARGFAVIERAFFDPVTLNAVLKFDVTLRHY